jgi:hypothetical protein
MTSKPDLDTLVGQLAKMLYLYQHIDNGRKILSVQVFHREPEMRLLLTFEDATTRTVDVTLTT